MNPSGKQIARISTRTAPRWFASPIFQADPSSTFSHHLGLLASKAFREHANALIFNIGRLEACLALLPLRGFRLCSLFQWIPLELQRPFKRLIYGRILRKSRVLATYSRISESYLRTLFPTKPIVWIGHFTDTDYFQPQPAGNSTERYFLVVGDHKRREDVIIDIAEALRTRIIRVSNDPRVVEYHSARKSSFVEIQQSIDFQKLRELYNEAELVLNVVDDSLWPVGITTFCEALSMNKIVVTSNQHSSSGYHFEDKSKPYYTVDTTGDVGAWLNAIQMARSHNVPWPQSRSPRDLAVTHCSFESATRNWTSIIELLDSEVADA